MDALSDVLRLVGVTGGVFLDAEFTAPWAVAGRLDPRLCRPFMVEPQQVICFHYVIEGGCRIETEGEPPRVVSAGEIVVLPRNDVHVLSGARGIAPVMIGELMRPPEGLGLVRLSHGGGGERTRMVCGFLGGNAQLHPFLAHLPAVMTLEIASVPGGDWMAQSFSYAARMMADGEPGAATVIAKMSELMFVETVRRHLALMPAEESGWLAGLRDPAIGRALALMHAELDRDWTAEAVAEAVNLSRSVFADRFTRLVGVPPMRYLLNWRLQIAMHRLRDTRQSVAEIAYAVGYQSEASFTRAFSRELGRPPATWRRQAGSGPP